MTTYQLFGSTSGPGSQVSDTDNYTMGVEFLVTTSGCTLTEIRFWASAEVAGSNHACRLYAVGNSTPITGSSKAFPTPLQAGWNTVTLDAPIVLTANTAYLACVYFTTDNGYTATGAYWSTGAGAAGLTSGPLSAPASGSQSGPAQGAFNAGADAIPNAGFNAGNYWVDVTIDDGEGGTTVTAALAGTLPALGGALAGDVAVAVTGVIAAGEGNAIPGQMVPGEGVPGSQGGGNLPALTGSLTDEVAGTITGAWAGTLAALSGQLAGAVTGEGPDLVEAQHPGLAGLVPILNAADADGQRVPPNVRLLVLNDGGSTETLTIEAGGTARGGLDIADRVIALPAGVFPNNATAVDVPGSAYRQTDGYCYLLWSDPTDVSFAVFGQVTT